jgi:hypothetical protein
MDLLSEIMLRRIAAHERRKPSKGAKASED